MTDARIHADAFGTIVFDEGITAQVGHDWFEPETWQRTGRLRARGGGRGAVCFVDTPAGPCVLRHFHRGGMVARLLGDRYLWSGREKTRSFAEFRLLVQMRALGLPVPQAVGARYCRHGIYYSADLLTRQIDHTETLGDCISEGRMDPALATRVGQLIAGFHRHGICHADLNAHNILLSASALHVVDFDRGEIRVMARRWQHANLQRLRRSLIKLGVAANAEAVFERELWTPLMHGYTSGLEQELPA